MTLPGGIPDATGPGMAPVDPQEWMRRRLFDRRVLVLNGILDDARATELGAGLMTLDATGDEPVDLQIDSADGSTGAALALIDIIDLLGVPVRAWCTGQAAGPALGVLAVCPYRSASPHARLHLVEPSVAFQGSARLLEQLADAHAEQWAAFCRRLAEATGQSVDQVTEDAARGRYLTASEAVAYGLVDEVAASPDPRNGRGAMGFRPG